MRNFAFLPAGLLLLCALSCSSDEAKPLPKSADSGFALDRDAFRFENFSWGYDASQMNAELAARMFGPDKVCKKGGDGCVPTADAQAWIDSANRSMEAGHCEGLAVLSQLFFL